MALAGVFFGARGDGLATIELDSLFRDIDLEMYQPKSGGLGVQGCKGVVDDGAPARYAHCSTMKMVR